jgi:L-lactate utilization protein LutC
MSSVENLLTQMQDELKKMRYECYHAGFKDAEGAANTMQKEFNDVQNLLLSVLGREQRCLETTLDTAQMVVDEIVKLRSLKSYDQGYEDA